jgi:hypothetical protein
MADRYCYVASKPGKPGAYAACSDADDYKAQAAKFCAREIKAGGVIQRVTSAKARTMLGEWLEWVDSSSPKQSSLMDSLDSRHAAK